MYITVQSVRASLGYYALCTAGKVQVLEEAVPNHYRFCAQGNKFTYVYIIVRHLQCYVYISDTTQTISFIEDR